MLIATGTLASDALAGQVAIVTGAGRGIGFEAARALAWLGARVVLAEIEPTTGRAAATRLTDEFGPAAALFVRTDVGSERDIERLERTVIKHYARVDIIINNAAVTPMGAVQDVEIQYWDASYRVNLRGPVLLAQAFLPAMIERDYGVFVCVSSVGEAFMGAYEAFKAAQVHLANTIDAELENTGVHAFAIGPGLVRTRGAAAGIAQLAPLYDRTVEEFYALSEAHILSPEAAGAGFAASVALAAQFRGQEVSSKQALIAAGIDLAEGDAETRALSPEQAARALEVCRRVRQTLEEQSAGWRERALFERQWVLRDFKKSAGMPIERWLDALRRLQDALEAQAHEAADHPHLSMPPVPLERLEAYYAHMQNLAKGHEKDAEKLADQLAIIQSWQNEVSTLIDLL